MKKRFVFLYTAFLFAMLFCLGISAADELASGIYTIQNMADERYLDVFDFSRQKNGYAYADTASGNDSQNILVLKQKNGTYLLYPQSEKGQYAFYVDSVSKRVLKNEQITPASYFHIVPNENGYIISTIYGTCFGTYTEETLKRKQLVLSEKFVDDATQKWQFTLVPISSLELKTVTKRINVNAVSAVYALVEPAYMADFLTWSCSDERVLLLDDDGSFCALSAGTATVTATYGDWSASIDVEVVDSPAFTWYSQHLTTNGGWHAAELANVYFYSGKYKRFIINGQNHGLDWMDAGCAVTSVAIVLHNLGARYTRGYDFRFNADGNVEADPYTVALANTNNRGLKTSSGTLYHNPILMIVGRIASNFNLYGQKIVSRTSHDITKAKLKVALDAHPEGVIVELKNSYNGTHYVVVTECLNPEAKYASDYKFKIYDPAGLHGYDGDNVRFEDSISYVYMQYRYEHLNTMIVFDFVPEEE